MLNQYRRNLFKTFEIIQTCFDLKEAYLLSQNPGIPGHEIRRRIYENIIHSKDRQWKESLKMDDDGSAQ
jgi:hypothetical protein